MCGKKKTYNLKNSDFAGNTAFVADRAYHRDKTNPLNNVLAVYEQVKDTITWSEQHLYGSSRLGMVQPQIVWKPGDSPEPGIPYFKQNKNQVYGARRYEITNHLGNVAAVISDRKMPFVHQSDVFFDAVVHSAADYFPFGSMMTGRTFSAGEYRYGFNTQEKVDEVKGSGNHYSAEFWEYDPRVVHRWNIDPRPNPSMSPYAILGGNPILYTDILGDSINVEFNDRKSKDAFKAFFETKDGKDFITDFAAKGQKLFNHTFENDGKFHKEGIDLAYNDKDFGSNRTDVGAIATGGNKGGTFVDGRLKLGVLINSTARNNDLINKINHIVHESLLHVNEYSLDFVDNRKIDYSHHSFYTRLSSIQPASKHHFFFRQNYENHPLSTKGLNIMQDVSKKHNLGYNRTQLWHLIWNFSN